MSTYDFSTLYTTLPHNLIKDKLIDLIVRTFNRECSPYLVCNDRNAFFLRKNLKNITHDLVCDALNVLLDNIFIQVDTKLYRQGFLWALTVRPWLPNCSCFVMRGTLRCLFLMISRLILLALLTLHQDYVPHSTSYGVYISQLIRFARASSHVADFNTHNKLETQKLLKQGYCYHKLRKTFSKFYRRYYNLILNSKLDLNLSCAKDFWNLNCIVTW